MNSSSRLAGRRNIDALFCPNKEYKHQPRVLEIALAIKLALMKRNHFINTMSKEWET
jgi:hypothetical protein